MTDLFQHGQYVQGSVHIGEKLGGYGYHFVSAVFRKPYGFFIYHKKSLLRNCPARETEKSLTRLNKSCQGSINYSYIGGATLICRIICHLARYHHISGI